VDPVPDPLILKKLEEPGIEPGTNSEAADYATFFIILLSPLLSPNIVTLPLRS
jgi:hypothetical protein